MDRIKYIRNAQETGLQYKCQLVQWIYLHNSRFRQRRWGVNNSENREAKNVIHIIVNPSSNYKRNTLKALIIINITTWVSCTIVKFIILSYRTWTPHLITTITISSRNLPSFSNTNLKKPMSVLALNSFFAILLPLRDDNHNDNYVTIGTWSMRELTLEAKS